jgi:putative transposase
VSRIHRLRLTDRVFFVSVNLRRAHKDLRDAEYSLLLDVINESRSRLKFLLCGYVLMPDHWHALIWVPPPLCISDALHDVKKVSAQRLHRARRTRGPFWQHQFWDRFVRNDKELHERLDYMHMNPVRKGLAKRPQDWRWSSYNNFSLDRAIVAACPTQIDYVRLPEGYRG